MSVATSQLRQAAVALAREGFTLIPCQPGDKRPKAMDRWKETMTFDPGTVDEVWSEGDWNVGIVCMPSGVFVLDVDGPVGEENLALLEAEHGRLPVTMECRTPGRGGGRHLYFAAPEGIQLLPKLAEKVDVKHNGYVLAPPSLHPEGGVYRWERVMSPAVPPAWLIERLERGVADDMPEREHLPKQSGGRWERPEDWFDSAFTCQDVMVEVLRSQAADADGWKYVGSPAGNFAYTRPGKSVRQGISLVVYKYSRVPSRPCPKHTAQRCEHCAWTRAQMFSTSDPDTPAGTYGPFRLFVHLGFRDDYGRARDWVVENGFRGKSWVRPSPDEIESMVAPAAHGLKLVFRKASTIVPVRKEWLVPALIPKGELTLITGKPGAGKSLLALDFIAHLTRGDVHPAGPGCLTKPGNVILLTGEEDTPSVIIPRLMAAGAVMERVMMEPRLADPSTGELRGWDLSFIEQLEEGVLDLGVHLIVCDVLKQIMRHRNDHDELEVRRELQPIVDLCHRTGVTFVGVRHTVKNPTSASSAGAGSQAYYALCRSELLITQEQDFDGTSIKVCTVNKSSYGAEGKRMEYVLDPTQVPVRLADGGDGSDDTVRVRWRGSWSLNADPDEVLATKAERSEERVFHEAVKRTLNGARALGFTLPINDFLRILSEHLDELEWEGGRSEINLKKWTKKIAGQGLVLRTIIRHGPPRGTESSVTLAEPFREA